MIKQFIDDYLGSFNSPLFTAVVVFAGYVLLAKIIDVITCRFIKKATKFTRSNIDDKIIDLVHRPIFYTVILIGSMHSIKLLNLEQDFRFYSTAILMTLISFIWAVCIIKISNFTFEHTIEKISDVTGLSSEVKPLVENIWTVLIIIGSIMVVLSIWEINITPLLASAGIAGVAIALAAKDTLANFFGGISIFIDKPYKIGDYIVLDRGERGEVVKIGIRSTRIKTRDDILISIPNSIIANTKIINESAPLPKFRIRVPISVAYGTDIEMVEDILMKIASDNDNVYEDPEPRVRFRTFGESSLDFELLCWAKEPALRGKTIHEINKAIYNRFNDEKIRIPFPHRTVYLREERGWDRSDNEKDS